MSKEATANIRLLQVDLFHHVDFDTSLLSEGQPQEQWLVKLEACELIPLMDFSRTTFICEVHVILRKFLGGLYSEDGRLVMEKDGLFFLIDSVRLERQVRLGPHLIGGPIGDDMEEYYKSFERLWEEELPVQRDLDIARCTCDESFGN